MAIARALVGSPHVLLADEPTGNLDTATSKQVLDLIQWLREQMGITIVMVTHDPRIAATADRRLHIIDGMLTDLDNPGKPTKVAESLAEVQA
ncbi:MAG TPA: hypothetical protein VHO48_12275 [Anaerolineaceae bacterium]|nr:hypothetical protein [Anaerolineaceae bacterium]